MCEIFVKNKFLLITAIILLLLVNFLRYVRQNTKPTPSYFANGYVLSDEMRAVDYTYQESMQKPFSISTLTAPLYVNTLWSYIYNWYGVKKYGYLPYWIGRDQIGQAGNDLQKAPVDLKEHFFIIEPTLGIPDLYVTYARGDQDAISQLTKSKSFGQISVEKRTIK